MEPHAYGDGCTGPRQHLMRTAYAMGGADGCIADARHHALAFLDRARADHRLRVPDRVRDIIQLVVSELVTNARKYAPGPVLMELRLTADSVDVAVWDNDPTVPVARPADPDRIGQHGLEIVKAVTAHLFVEQEPVGKRITARITLADPLVGDPGDEGGTGEGRPS